MSYHWWRQSECLNLLRIISCKQYAWISIWYLAHAHLAQHLHVHRWVYPRYMDKYRLLTGAYIHTHIETYTCTTRVHTPHTDIWLPWLAAASNMDWIIRQRWWEMWEGHNRATSPNMKRCLIRESSVHVLSEGVDSVEKKCMQAVL